MKFLGKDPNIIDAYYTATAEGAITAGKPVIVEADGDVAQVVPTGGSSAAVGTAVNYTSEVPAGTSSEDASSIVFDPSNNKVVIFLETKITVITAQASSAL